MIELRGICKYFPSNGVTALQGVDFTLKPGEIHALLGENGSGKSTLMHILAGYSPPSSGEIFVGGEKRHFSSHADALALGIGMVRQFPDFVRGFKVWEDCVLGSEKQGQNRLFFDPARLRKRVEEKAALWHFDLPLDAKAESLTVSQRQKAALLSLLLRNVQWFVFDEPTTALPPDETKNLFELYKRLRNEGRSIVFITHKTDEALDVSDRITVLKAGAIYTKGYLEKNLTQRGIEPRTFGSMVRCTEENGAWHLFEHPVLEVKDLHLEPPGLPPVKNINFRLMSGRILGITGDRNSGLETLELAITGLLNGATNKRNRTNIKGSITINGKNVAGKGVLAFRDAGGAYLGADRLGNNLAPELPLSESLVIHVCRRARRGIFLNMGHLDSWCEKIMGMAGIVRFAKDRANSFSGGMIQRILLAREFAEGASLIVLAEAGSSLDEASRAKLTDDLQEYARQGKAILLFSADMEELRSLADEIIELGDYQ